MGSGCIGVPSTGIITENNPIMGLLVVVLLIVVSIIAIASRRRGRWNSMLGIFVAGVLAVTMAGGMTYTSYAAPDDCNTSGTSGSNGSDSDESANQTVSAQDDIFMPTPPTGGFPTGSPYLFGYSYNSGSFGDGVTNASSIAMPVVASNDSGDLDQSTVDLASDVPGVQHEVVAMGVLPGSENLYTFTYSYDPDTDLVTVTPYGAYWDAWSEYQDVNGWQGFEVFVQFVHDYIVDQGSVPVTAVVDENIDAYDQIDGSLLPPDHYVGWVFQFTIPYTVESTDGQQTGANIILPLVTIYQLIIG